MATRFAATAAALAVSLLLIRPAWADSPIVFGPKTFQRQTGAPTHYVEQFKSCEANSTHRLVVRNGLPDKSRRLSSAVIRLNGAVVIGPSDLSQVVAKVERPVLLAGDNRLELELAGAPDGLVEVVVECVTNCFGVTIERPANGAFIQAASVLVTGTVQSSSAEVGVAGPHEPGVVDGPPYRFAIAAMPVAPGGNRLRVRATNACGLAAEASVTVQAPDMEEEAEAAMLVLAAPPSGTPPLEVELTAVALVTPAAGYHWNVTGATEPDVTVRFEQPGLYFPTVSVTDADGVRHEATAVVQVFDPQRLGPKLLAKWSAMRAALQGGRIDAALEQFTHAARPRYRQIFEALGAKLPETAAAMQEPELMSIAGTTAKYRIQRTVTIDGQTRTLTFWIYFIQDGDGIWRIRQF